MGFNKESKLSADFISSSNKQFQFYKNLGDRCFDQLPEDDLYFWTANENNNSIAVIVQHLHGNMMSRWTNFLEEDGEKEWRDRDGEFELSLTSKAEIILKWEEAWHCLFASMGKIEQTNLDQLVYIRNMGHTIIEAIQRQLCHYAYHIGQIIYIAKLQRDEWSSLSIAKGESIKYNTEKFSKDKHRKHFSDEFISKKQL